MNNVLTRAMWYTLHSQFRDPKRRPRWCKAAKEFRCMCRPTPALKGAPFVQCTNRVMPGELYFNTESVVKEMVVRGHNIGVPMRICYHCAQEVLSHNQP